MPLVLLVTFEVLEIAFLLRPLHVSGHRELLILCGLLKDGVSHLTCISHTFHHSLWVLLLESPIVSIELGDLSFTVTCKDLRSNDFEAIRVVSDQLDARDEHLADALRIILLLIQYQLSLVHGHFNV